MTNTLQKSAETVAESKDGRTGTLTVDEIIARHRGDWVLMRVTEDDEDGWPERGYLLDVAPTQEEILQAWERRAPELSDDNRWPLYSFLAEPLITSGPEYNAAVMEFFGGLLQAGGLLDAYRGR
jgi:hypothetical protein